MRDLSVSIDLILLVTLSSRRLASGSCPRHGDSVRTGMRSFPAAVFPNGSELNYRLTVSRPSHRLFGSDQTVQRKETTIAKWKIQRNTVLDHRVEPPNSRYRAETIELSPVRAQIQILQPSARVCVEVERQTLRRHPVNGMKVRNNLLQSKQVLGSKSASNVEIERDQSGTVRRGGVTADDDKFYSVLQQPLQQ